ncbi:MAG TPA: ribosome biogenesis GTP-binding protein YihA/YsxC [Terriglobales bacterium]|nr:ribosome biogenesis GTP-binding protein YihA/YsxC [Terriglobales bacterium]
MIKVHAKFVLSAADARQFPAASLPEIAFLGRSNVGKSSVLNSLVGEKIARTSATPGRTRTINFFELRRQGRPEPELRFADLPGYGYARLPREVTAEWPSFIEPYLAQRSALALSIALVDPRAPTQESDRRLLEWLRGAGREYLVVATKSDRLSGNELANALRRLRTDLGTERVLPYSAKTGSGRDELWREIWTAASRRIAAASD